VKLAQVYRPEDANQDQPDHAVQGRSGAAWQGGARLGFLPVFELCPAQPMDDDQPQDQGQLGVQPPGMAKRAVGPERQLVQAAGDGQQRAQDRQDVKAATQVRKPGSHRRGLLGHRRHGPRHRQQAAEPQHSPKQVKDKRKSGAHETASSRGGLRLVNLPVCPRTAREAAGLGDRQVAPPAGP